MENGLKNILGRKRWIKDGNTGDDGCDGHSGNVIPTVPVDSEEERQTPIANNPTICYIHDMTTFIHKADHILNKVLIGCIYALLGIVILFVVGTVGAAICIYMSDFAKVIGIIAGGIIVIAVTVTLCKQFIIFKLATKTLLAIAGISGIAYIMHGIICALI